MRLRVVTITSPARYGLAIALIVVAAALRVALNPLWGVGLPYITFYPAVMLAAWLGGLGPGLLATALSVLLADYFWIPPALTFAVDDRAEVLGLIVFATTGVIISVLNEAWRRSTMAAFESQQRLAVTLTSIGDGVITTDADGRITRMNPVAQDLVGWNEREAVGRPWHDVCVLVDEQTRQPVLSPVDRVLEEGVIVGLANHTVLIARDGREIPIDDSAAPIRAENGEISGVVMIFRDVADRRRAEREREAMLEREQRARVETERLADAERVARENAEHVARALRESEERLRITFASIGDAVLVTDEQGRITRLNPVGEKLTGWRQADAIGRPIQDIFVIVNEETRQPAPHPVEQVLREGVVAALANHTVLISKAGEETPIDDSAAPVRANDGRLLGTVLVFRDISERRQVERERAARARLTRELAAIVESSDDAIVSKNVDGMVTGWNRAAEQMYGYAADEAVGQSVRLIVPEDLLHEEESVLQRIRRGERVEHFETRRRRKDGSTVHVSITVSPIRDDSGAVIGASKVARDITARKQTEMERAMLLESERTARQNLEVAVQQLQTALHAGRMGTWEYALRTGALKWSPGLEAIHGYPSGTFPGTFEAFRNEIHPEDRERVLRAIADAGERGRDHHVEYRIIRADGAVRWVQGIGQVVVGEDARAERMIGVCMDITERKQMDQQRAEVLEQEQRARAELDHASRLKDEFLAVLSHELRTPLNAVLGYAHLLGSGALPAERVDHALQAIQRNAQAQARLVESLLDLSRIMAGKLELDLEHLDVSALIDAAVDVVRPEAEAKQIALNVVMPSKVPRLVGDGGRLQQVLWNLLSNAIKFTPSGGRIDVLAAQQDGEVTVSISDTGQGITPAFLPYVFDRFKQADGNKHRSPTGLGLGLALVREMVHAHGGTVVAESPGDGQGSTFTVRLPLSPTLQSELVRPRAAQTTIESLPRIDILIVDDDGDVRDLLGLLLQSHGAVVRTATSAAEALDAIARQTPDVLLADVGMPEEDGYSLIRKVRAHEQRHNAARLPAIAVTAYATSADREQALAEGYDWHIPKPVDPQTLARAISKVAKPQEV
jgi:PAS domain S-box-containing protein